jgi:superfamily II DNA or RNA helicase
MSGPPSVGASPHISVRPGRNAQLNLMSQEGKAAYSNLAAFAYLSARPMSPHHKRFLPRPYQSEGRQGGALPLSGARKMLLHLPTGAGRTIIATLVIERLLPLIGSGKVLFIAHRRELLDQTAEKLGQHLPGLAIGIDQGSGARICRHS